MFLQFLEFSKKTEFFGLFILFLAYYKYHTLIYIYIFQPTIKIINIFSGRLN